MNISYEELALLAGGAGLIVKLLDKAFIFVEGLFKKGDKDNSQQIDIELLKQLNKIESNDLAHLKIQVECGMKERMEIKINQARMEEKIDAILKKVS